jgi:predicted SAM-dependent methyltransferase
MKEFKEKLHLGCGDFAPEGWLNTDGSWHAWLGRHPLLKKIAALIGALPKHHLDKDWPKTIVILDLRNPLPFPDNSFQAVYSSHVLEHLYRNEALNLLKEIYRVCCEGAIVRMVVPDLQVLIANYLHGVVSPQAPSPTTADTFVYHLYMYPPIAEQRGSLVRWYHAIKDFDSHKWMYDVKSLSELYKNVGFLNPKRKKILESEITDINFIERPERLGQNSLILEAIKE